MSGFHFRNYRAEDKHIPESTESQTLAAREPHSVEDGIVRGDREWHRRRCRYGGHSNCCYDDVKVRKMWSEMTSSEKRREVFLMVLVFGVLFGIAGLSIYLGITEGNRMAAKKAS